MQKTVVTVVPLVTILILFELATAKPNPELINVMKKPIAGSPDAGMDFTNSDYSDFNTPDIVTPDDRKIIGDVDPDKSSLLILQQIPVKTGNTVVKPGIEKPSSLPASLKPAGPERPSILITNLKPYPGTPSSLITSSEPVSEDKDENSLVTSLDPVSGEADNFVTITLEPGSLSTTQNIGSGKPGSLLTTSESDSESRRNSETTLMPDSHHLENKFSNLPVTSESKNGASGIGSSCMMVLLGILLISGFQVT